MSTVRVVTDSSCDLPCEWIGDLPITVLPNRVRLGDQTYLDGVDLTTAQIQARAQELMVQPVIEPPDLQAFTQAFGSLAKHADGIISIHASSKLAGAASIATQAKTYTIDRCQIVPVDSESATMGLGYIVLQAARAAQDGQPVREILDLVRTIVHQTHVVFIADAGEAATLLGRHRNRVQPLAAVTSGGGVATMVAAPPAPSGNARPVLKLEEGKIIPIEHVRNRTKALERLFEFVEIFPTVEELCIVHGRSLTDVEWLLKRLDPIYPRKDIRVVPYGPAVAQFVGNHAVGIVAYEGPECNY